MAILDLDAPRNAGYNVLGFFAWIAAFVVALMLFFDLPTENHAKCYSLAKTFFGRERIFGGTILLHVILSAALSFMHLALLAFGSDASDATNSTKMPLLQRHHLAHEKAKGLFLLIGISSWSALSLASLALPLKTSEVFGYVNDVSKTFYGSDTCTISSGLIVAYITLTAVAAFLSLHFGFLLALRKDTSPPEDHEVWYARMPKWGQPQWGALSYIYYVLLAVVVGFTFAFGATQDMFDIGREGNDVAKMFANATFWAPLNVNFTHYNVTRDLIHKYSKDFNGKKGNWADNYVFPNAGLSIFLLLLAGLTTWLIHTKTTDGKLYSKYSRDDRTLLLHGLSVLGFVALLLGLMFSSSTALPLVIQDYGDVAKAVWRNGGVQEWKRGSSHPNDSALTAGSLLFQTTGNVRKNNEPDLRPHFRLLTVAIWWLLAIVSTTAIFTVSKPGGFAGKYMVAQSFSTSADPEGQPLVYTAGAVAGAVMGTSRSHRASSRW